MFLNRPGAEQVVFVNGDSTHRQVHGYQKDGAAVGRHKGKKTLPPLLATVSTPIARPVVAGIRLRKASPRRCAGRPGSGSWPKPLAVVRQIAPTATIVVRADSKFYTADLVATAAPAEEAAGARPVDRAAGQAAQPRRGHR
jgi:hypothetical protein